MVHQLRRRVRVSAALAALVLLPGCDPVLSRRFNRMLELFETVLYATFACCGFLFLVLFIGNLLALGYNVLRPSRSSRLAGFGFGVPHAALGFLLGITAAIEPPRQSNPDGFSTSAGAIDWVQLLVGLGFSGLLVLLGIGSIAAAMHAGSRLADRSP